MSRDVVLVRRKFRRAADVSYFRDKIARAIARGCYAKRSLAEAENAFF